MHLVPNETRRASQELRDKNAARRSMKMLESTGSAFEAMWRRFRRRLEEAVSSPWFDNVFLVLIILNVLLMASEHFEQPEYWSAVLAASNVVFSFLFLIELLIKVVALGKRYFTDLFNILDFVVVIFSCVDVFVNIGASLN